MNTYSSEVALPPIGDERFRKSVAVGKFHERANIRERRIRDVYFEKRGGQGPRSDAISTQPL